MKLSGSITVRLVTALFFIWVFSAAIPARAHEVRAVSALANFERDGTYQLKLSLEIMAQGDPTLDDQTPPEQAALDYLSNAITLHFDRTKVSPEFSTPELVQRDNPLPGDNLTTLLYSEASGVVPKGAKNFLIQLSPETDVNLQMVVIKDGVRERRAHAIYAGEFSRPVDLSFIGEQVIEGDPFTAEAEAEQSEAMFGQSLVSGLQRGELLVLFAVLALLGRSFRDLGLQAAAMWLGVLLGHAATLILNLTVEGSITSAIAGLAILGMAVNNVMRPQIDNLRLALCALAGLLIGLGTRAADAVTAAVSLVGFHLGSAIAISLLGLVIWAVLGAFWQRDWFRQKISMPFSFLLAGAGAFWILSGF